MSFSLNLIDQQLFIDCYKYHFMLKIFVKKAINWSIYKEGITFIKIRPLHFISRN
jgi:hypothetical protein